MIWIVKPLGYVQHDLVNQIANAVVLFQLIGRTAGFQASDGNAPGEISPSEGWTTLA